MNVIWRKKHEKHLMFNFNFVIFSPKISFIGAFLGQMVINFGTTGFWNTTFLVYQNAGDSSWTTFQVPTKATRKKRSNLENQAPKLPSLLSKGWTQNCWNLGSIGSLRVWLTLPYHPGDMHIHLHVSWRISPNVGKYTIHWVWSPTSNSDH